MFHLFFELARTPARVADERPDGRGIFVHELMRFVDADVVIQFQPLALLPFERREHQLILPHRAAEKYRHVCETVRRRFVHQVGHLFIKRTVEDHAQCPVIRVMRGDE